MLGDLPFSIDEAIIIGHARQVVANLNDEFVRFTWLTVCEIDLFDCWSSSVETNGESAERAAFGF